MKRLILVASLVVALFPRSAAAQTVTQVMKWNHTEPVATVQGWVTFVKIGAAAAVQVTPSCVAAGSGTACVFPLPSVTPSGTVITLTEANGGPPSSGSATVPAGPSNPTNVTITITVTIP